MGDHTCRGFARVVSWARTDGISCFCRLRFTASKRLLRRTRVRVLSRWRCMPYAVGNLRGRTTAQKDGEAHAALSREPLRRHFPRYFSLTSNDKPPSRTWNPSFRIKLLIAHRHHNPALPSLSSFALIFVSVDGMNRTLLTLRPR